MHKVLPPVPYISCFIECLQSYYIFHSLGDTRGNREKRNLQKERKFIFVTGKEEDCISEFHPVSIEALMYMERKRKKKNHVSTCREKRPAYALISPFDLYPFMSMQKGRIDSWFWFVQETSEFFKVASNMSKQTALPCWTEDYNVKSPFYRFTESQNYRG